jgi:exonuclease III
MDDNNFHKLRIMSYYCKSMRISFSSNNRRICSIRVCGAAYKLILINVYMPYESDTEAAEEFSSVLADVVALVDQFNDHCFVIGGDFNVDFDKHNIHPRLLLDVCNDNDFRIATLNDTVPSISHITSI